MGSGHWRRVEIDGLRCRGHGVVRRIWSVIRNHWYCGRLHHLHLHSGHDCSGGGLLGRARLDGDGKVGIRRVTSLALSDLAIDVHQQYSLSNCLKRDGTRHDEIHTDDDLHYLVLSIEIGDTVQLGKRPNEGHEGYES